MRAHPAINSCSRWPGVGLGSARRGVGPAENCLFGTGTSYVAVDSLDASVERAQELGATVMKAKTAVPSMGWFAMLTDPEGNLFAMWQSDSGAA